MRNIMILIVVLSVLSAPISAKAVDVAPRISDREIIESLATLKQGQADLNKRFDDLNRSIDKRFDSVNQRITDFQTTMLALAGGMFALIISMFGYIAWDRRTYMRPIQERMDRYETILHKELDITNDAGSVLTRLVKALKELAKTDQKVAEVLRSFSLL
jgi:hypothetical protein